MIELSYQSKFLTVMFQTICHCSLGMSLMFSFAFDKLCRCLVPQPALCRLCRCLVPQPVRCKLCRCLLAAAGFFAQDVSLPHGRSLPGAGCVVASWPQPADGSCWCFFAQYVVEQAVSLPKAAASLRYTVSLPLGRSQLSGCVVAAWPQPV